MIAEWNSGHCSLHVPCHSFKLLPRDHENKIIHLFQQVSVQTSGCSCTDLTPVIMGALFDLRRAPPPAPPAAPAHWSTSIRSISLIGRPGRGSTRCRPAIHWRRCRALLEPGGSPTCRPHEPQTQSRQVSEPNAEAVSRLPHPPRQKRISAYVCGSDHLCRNAATSNSLPS